MVRLIRAVILKKPSPIFLHSLALFATCALEEANCAGSLDRALKVLDLVTPKSNATVGENWNHLQVMQGCVEELLSVGASKKRTQKFPKCNKLKSNLEEILILNLLQDHRIRGRQRRNRMGRSVLPRDENLLLFVDMHREGMKPSATVVSGVLSSCGTNQAIYSGVQLHCFSVKIGLDINVSVGSSLVSVYAKCGLLENAQLLFEEMPVKNVVSWTALIMGFAHHCQVEACFEWFCRMRETEVKPNDFTFASLLSVCTGSGFLGQGMRTHCLIVQMGFCLYVHVSNALISMYSKCGLIEEADYLFQGMVDKDQVSWNSMIAGYAQHGLAEKAIHLFKNMEKRGIEPDAISFLGVLSSCRHVGLLEQGLFYFSLMADQGIKPELDHYSCMIDLFGRCGMLDDAWAFIEKMPINPNAIIWGSLLSSCRLYGKVWMGIRAAENRLLLEPDCSSTHVQLASLYASVGCWDQVARVRKLMKEKHLKPNIGYSWIEIGNNVYKFKVEDCSSTTKDEISVVIDGLLCHMISLGSVLKADISLHD